MKKTITFCSALFIGFAAFSQSVGIIGSAVAPYDWSVDVDMTTTDNVNYTVTVDLLAAEAKFRQDDGWTINWGAGDFPSGVGVQDGPNIPISEAGVYNVTLNITTGEYTFTLSNSINEINKSVSKCFPNPANEVVKFEINSNDFEISIADITGKVVKTSTVSEVNISDLNIGTYIYTVSTEGNISTGKLLKK
jgi:hypothetical protein